MLISEFIAGKSQVKPFVAGLSPDDELDLFLELLVKETPAVFFDRAASLMKDTWNTNGTFSSAVNALYRAIKIAIVFSTPTASIDLLLSDIKREIVRTDRCATAATSDQRIVGSNDDDDYMGDDGRSNEQIDRLRE